jgi:hypothetical protein
MASAARLHLARVWTAATFGYVMLACALTWPLPLHLKTHLLGDPTGDLSVYVWNVWIFRHELIEHGHLPFSTDHVFAYTGDVDFALHNYTPLAGLLGVPLIDWLGLVAAFNVISIAVIALTGVGVFVLARRLGLGSGAAWCAGALFTASPTMTARGAEHFSLITAAALPLFAWATLRALDTKRWRDAILVGGLVAAATYCDAYYGIYSVLIGTFLVMWRFCRVEWRGRGKGSRLPIQLVEYFIAATTGLIIWRLLSGTTQIVVAGLPVGLETLYTPMLALVTLLAMRAWLAYRPVLKLSDPENSLGMLMHRGLVAVGVCSVLLLPPMIGITARYNSGRLPDAETYWRSSPAGVDLLAYLVPNPVHPWFGSSTRSWFATDGIDGFPEFVGSFSLVALIVIVFAAARRLLPRMWIVFTALAVLLSVGPFIHVAGVNTYIIGPWAILRYVPIIGMARSPSRIAVLAVLGLSLLFAFAAVALSRSMPRWRLVATVIALLLSLELTPAPRVLYSAEVPDVYRLIVENGDRVGRVLELPTGMRDGTSSLGKFNPANQYFQTRHQRAMVGGYVSRMSGWRKREGRQSPLLNGIFELSEGRSISADLRARAREERTAFLRRTCVRFVVVDKLHASHELREFAVDTLSLSLMHADDTYELLTPVDPPPCEPRRRRAYRLVSDDTPRLTPREEIERTE